MFLKNHCMLMICTFHFEICLNNLFPWIDLIDRIDQEINSTGKLKSIFILKLGIITESSKSVLYLLPLFILL